MKRPPSTIFDPRLGDPATWSHEKWEAVFDFRNRHHRWPTHEIWVCLGCSEVDCKSDCPAGQGKALA